MGEGRGEGFEPTHQIFARRSGVFAENRASLRVQHKLGFAAIGRSTRHSLARGEAIPHIDTVLTRGRFQALNR